jgi:threonine/homoserine/homoserine lactone efflux protein
MPDLPTFALFLVAVATLLLSPGPNMVLVMSYGVAQGPQAGVAAAGGVAVANLLLTMMTATGITALVAAWPPSFDVLRYAGAAYLGWLAYRALAAARPLAGVAVSRRSLLAVLRHGTLNCLLNPKVLLFHLVFIPQFVAPAKGDIPLQLAVLGVTMSVLGFVFNGAVGATSGRLGALLAKNPQAARRQGTLLGVVLLAIAVQLVLLERPPSP